jgi:hypothetical protein
MIMFEQSRRLHEPLRWGRREKLVVACLVACVAVAAVTLIVFAASGGAPARADCVDVTFPSTVGAANIHACGARAREVCASGAYRGVEDELRRACRGTGFPFRPSP